jgi:hypothetical protein
MGEMRNAYKIYLWVDLDVHGRISLKLILKKLRGGNGVVLAGDRVHCQASVFKKAGNFLDS